MKINQLLFIAFATALVSKLPACKKHTTSRVITPPPAPEQSSKNQTPVEQDSYDRIAEETKEAFRRYQVKRGNSPAETEKEALLDSIADSAVVRDTSEMAESMSGPGMEYAQLEMLNNGVKTEPESNPTQEPLDRTALALGITGGSIMMLMALPSGYSYMRLKERQSGIQAEIERLQAKQIEFNEFQQKSHEEITKAKAELINAERALEAHYKQTQDIKKPEITIPKQAYETVRNKKLTLPQAQATRIADLRATITSAANDLKQTPEEKFLQSFANQNTNNLRKILNRLKENLNIETIGGIDMHHLKIMGIGNDDLERKALLEIHALKRAEQIRFSNKEPDIFGKPSIPMLLLGDDRASKWIKNKFEYRATLEKELTNLPLTKNLFLGTDGLDIKKIPIEALEQLYIAGTPRDSLGYLKTKKQMLAAWTAFINHRNFASFSINIDFPLGVIYDKSGMPHIGRMIVDSVSQVTMPSYFMTNPVQKYNQTLISKYNLNIDEIDRVVGMTEWEQSSTAKRMWKRASNVAGYATQEGRMSYLDWVSLQLRKSATSELLKRRTASPYTKTVDEGVIKKALTDYEGQIFENAIKKAEASINIANFYHKWQAIESGIDTKTINRFRKRVDGKDTFLRVIKKGDEILYYNLIHESKIGWVKAPKYPDGTYLIDGKIYPPKELFAYIKFYDEVSKIDNQLNIEDSIDAIYKTINSRSDLNKLRSTDIFTLLSNPYVKAEWDKGLEDIKKARKETEIQLTKDKLELANLEKQHRNQEPSNQVREDQIRQASKDLDDFEAKKNLAAANATTYEQAKTRAKDRFTQANANYEQELIRFENELEVDSKYRQFGEDLDTLGKAKARTETFKMLSAAAGAVALLGGAAIIAGTVATQAQGQDRYQLTSAPQEAERPSQAAINSLMSELSELEMEYVRLREYKKNLQ